MKIPYGKQEITEEDILSVINTLKSDWLTQGPSIKIFEENFSKYVKAKYAVAVSNGTAALHLSVMSMNLKPGDKVITTPLTFAATANAIKYCGGEVIFCDIDKDTYLLDINKLENILMNDKTNNIKGIIPVNLAGNVTNLEKIKILSEKYNKWIIEDACHSPGGFFINSKNEIINSGSCLYSDTSIFSFHPVKHIAAGEGGMITTNNFEIYKRLLNLRTHGIQQDHSKKTENHGQWYYEMQELGYNYRLTDIQASLGNSQLKKADQRLNIRYKIAKKYNEFFSNKKYVINHSGYIKGHAYHLYIINVNNRDSLFKYLRDKNIFCQVHYIPLHLMPYYKQFGWKKGDLPNAESYYKTCISLPIYPSLKDEELDFVINSINDFYGE